MSTWLAAATREIIRSGIRAGLIPRPGRSATSRVAIGALLSGASVLLVTTPRRRPRRARRRIGMFADPSRGIADQPGRAGSGQSDPLGETAEIILPPGVRPLAGPAWHADPAQAGGPAPAADPAARGDKGPEDGAPADGRKAGYRSKHRREEPETGQWRPDAAGSRQRAPRHAAPPAGFSSRMASRLTVRPLVGAGRN